MLTRRFTGLRTTPDPLLLLVAATAIGFGDFYAYGAFTPRSLKLVTLGCIAVAMSMVLPRLRTAYDVLVPQVAVVTLVLWQGLTLVRATIIYGHGHALSNTRYLSIALPVVAAVAVVTTGVVSDWWWRVLVVGFALGAVLTIRASPRPTIDVWYLVQHASDCVLRGCNPYTLTTPDAPGLQDGFPYLPMTAVLLAPFRLLFGDVRYGEALAIVVAALLLRRCGTARTMRLAPLLLAVPGLFFEIEQAWTESLLVPLVVAAAAVSLRGRPGSRHWIGAGVLLGLALGSKQHMWLLLPVAWLALGRRTTAVAAATGAVSVLPWFLADPGALWRNTVTNFVHIDPRVDALTYWLHEPDGAQTVLAVMVLAAAYGLAWLCCHGVPHRFLLGCGAVLAGFDLMNKQSFYNQWVLVCWLLLAAAALALELGPDREPDREFPIVTREV
jgi:hypothetical protein